MSKGRFDSDHAINMGFSIKSCPLLEELRVDLKGNFLGIDGAIELGNSIS